MTQRIHSAVDEHIILHDSLIQDISDGPGDGSMNDGRNNEGDLIMHNASEMDHLKPDEPMCEHTGDMPSFLTTNSGKNFEQISFGQHLIGSHVIFNEHGQLLI